MLRPCLRPQILLEMPSEDSKSCLEMPDEDPNSCLLRCQAKIPNPAWDARRSHSYKHLLRPCLSWDYITEPQSVVQLSTMKERGGEGCYPCHRIYQFSKSERLRGTSEPPHKLIETNIQWKWFIELEDHHRRIQAPAQLRGDWYY